MVPDDAQSHVNTQPLNQRSPVPLYFQLAELIKEQIKHGALKPGYRLPAERELAEQASISRMTVRQAINHLVQEGVLVVKHGAGTFVAEPKLTHEALHLSGFTEEMARRGITATSRVLEQALVMPAQPAATALNLQSSERAVKVVRLRLLDDAPVLLEMSLLPSRLCPGLEHTDLEDRSLYSTIEQQYALSPRRARQSLEALVPDANERQLLGLSRGIGVIAVQGVTYTDGDVPIEYFRALYRGDRFRFEWESQRHAALEAPAAARLNLVLA
jgi:GntR family transcriptional regulator